MLHTIKNLSVLAMFAIVAMAFSACSSDNDDQPEALQQLLGSWQPVSQTNTDAATLANVYETWYKDLTWDKHQVTDGKAERVRKGAFNITNERIHLRNTCPRGRDVIEIDYKYEIKGNDLTLTDMKTKVTTHYKRRN